MGLLRTALILSRMAPLEWRWTPCSCLIAVILFVAAWHEQRRGATLEVVGISYEKTVTQGQLWRIVTASVVHLDAVHLVSVIAALWACREVEAAVGPTAFASASLLMTLLPQACGLHLRHRMLANGRLEATHPQIAATARSFTSCGFSAAASGLLAWGSAMPQPPVPWPATLVCLIGLPALSPHGDFAASTAALLLGWFLGAMDFARSHDMRSKYWLAWWGGLAAAALLLTRRAFPPTVAPTRARGLQRRGDDNGGDLAHRDGGDGTDEANDETGRLLPASARASSNAAPPSMAASLAAGAAATAEAVSSLATRCLALPHFDVDELLRLAIPEEPDLYPWWPPQMANTAAGSAAAGSTGDDAIGGSRDGSFSLGDEEYRPLAGQLQGVEGGAVDGASSAAGARSISIDASDEWRLPVEDFLFADGAQPPGSTAETGGVGGALGASSGASVGSSSWGLALGAALRQAAEASAVALRLVGVGALVVGEALRRGVAMARRALTGQRGRRSPDRSRAPSLDGFLPGHRGEHLPGQRADVRIHGTARPRTLSREGSGHGSGGLGGSDDESALREAMRRSLEDSSGSGTLAGGALTAPLPRLAQNLPAPPTHAPGNRPPAP